MSDLRTANTQQIKAESVQPAQSPKHKGKDLPHEVQSEAKAIQPGNAERIGNVVGDKAQSTSTENQEDRKRDEIEKSVALMNDYLQKEERKINFRMDEDAGVTVIKVYDATTNEVIRQIPSEEMLSLAQKLNKDEPMSLFSAQV